MRWLTWSALGLALATGCTDDAGTPCRYDYHCYSNSCTFGSCDSALGAAIADAIIGEDEDEDEDAYNDFAAHGPPDSEPCPLLCEVLSEHNCEQEPGCELSYECGRSPECLSSGSIECILATCSPFFDEDECEAPCAMLPRCTGRRSCDGLF